MLKLLDPTHPHDDFPPVEQALADPDGLLAAGGDLSPPRLLRAYRHGVFPWYNPGEPILWWSPDPRLILFPGRLKISRSLGKVLKKGEFTLTWDQAFPEVVEGCAAPRRGKKGTWITPEMKTAYLQLHGLGFAHSVECWRQGELVGGLYGVAIGRVFFGESMFHRFSNASKVAIVGLCRWLRNWRYALIDCQVRTDHLASLGAEEIPRSRFVRMIRRWCDEPPSPAAWESV